MLLSVYFKFKFEKSFIYKYLEFTFAKSTAKIETIKIIRLIYKGSKGLCKIHFISRI